MKPVKLQFKGINSFSEQTEIDFEKLTKTGIFGIFGDTGSGKSTILDCINFALYGRVERSKEKSDIINYRSDAAEVKFEFDVLTEGKRKRFTVERNIKKKSGIHKATLYEDNLCIADNASTVTKKITEVLGVDAEDFRKCIALPQGEFSQFVKSQPSERIALIERLFSLSKYGDRLKERLKRRESEAEIAYKTISAKLGIYCDISEEIIKGIENEISLSNKQAELSGKESDRAEKQYLQLKALDEKRIELEITVNKLNSLEGKKQSIEYLRSGLKVAPICKSVAETDEQLKQKQNIFTEIQNSLSIIGKGIQTENGKIETANKFKADTDYDAKIAECITLAAKYSACSGKPQKLAAIQRSLDLKREQFTEKKEQYKKLQTALEAKTAELEKLQKSIADCGTKNLEHLINVTFKGAVLKEEYVNSLDYFVGLNGQVQFHKDNSCLYEFLNRELKQQIDIYKDRVLQVKDFHLEDAQEQLKNIQAYDEQREKLTAELNKCNAELSKIQSSCSDVAKDMQIIKRDGEELRKQADELKSELYEAYGDVKDYSTAEKNNLIILEKLKNQKAQLETDIQEANNKLTKLAAEQAAKQAESKSVEEEIVRINDTLNTLLKQSGFDNILQCENFARQFSKMSDAENQIEQFDKQLISLTERKKQLEETDGLKDFSKQQLIIAEEKKFKLSGELSALREKLAVLQSDLKKAYERLSEKKILQKQLADAEKDVNLVAQLKELTKGNKFMEFIANEYLYDISTLASTTLLNLTDGRYYLTYTDTFYAGDNFNCGNLRGVNTLSGGETFLVSLSLALALSQTICSSLKSIEFFFLDEGFGTLDSTLVDTVMNALEKLKSSRFTIGVISHVEELKHRIDNKIIVSKATETHGSTVQISC